MIKDGRVRIIDFHGGRIGPLAYDLASLLIDPYLALSSSLQLEIKNVYLEELQNYIPYNRSQFEREYILLSLQRNLQILGAFAFLSRQREKDFFTQFIPPALQTLNTLLAKPEATDYGGLRELTCQCLFSLKRNDDS
jgi:aminoglycoside/choline kinase family phosphotransferase